MQPDLGVIFDMDGVLVDSASAHRHAWQQLGTEIGTAFSDELFGRTFGQRNASIIPVWLGPTPADRADALADRKEVRYRDLVRRGAVRIYPGVLDLIRALRHAGAATAVASSGPRLNVALLIETIGLNGVLDAVVTAEDVNEGKPHPQVFLLAAERLRIDPWRCAVVEDSVHGIEAAVRGGMLAMAVLTSTVRARLEAAGAEMVVPEVAAIEVPDVLRRLRHRPVPSR